MTAFRDSLRGYGHNIYKRDGFKCVYCGLDGSRSFSSWLNLSCDHLLPRDNPNWNNPEFIVTACIFCNGADNHYFKKAKERGITFKSKNRDELIDQRKPYVLKTRNEYKDFWAKNVRS